MRIQIRTLNVPKIGQGAFLPTLTWGAAPATNGQNIVTGAPGTVKVASPRPPALNDNSWGGLWQSSSVAPNYIAPSIYVAHANPSLVFDGKKIGNNVLPVPAIADTRIPAQTQYKPRIGGRTVTSNTRPFTQWPTYGQQG
jgi:hypothetical protein